MRANSRVAMVKSARCTLLAVALLAQANVLHATSQASDITLGEIVVTATRSETRLQDMPLHTTIVTQEAINNSPARTLDQLLRNVPSLLVSGSPSYTTDPTGHNIKFRGMDKKVLVLADGVPVLDPFYTTIQWYKLPLSSIERVEVVRGGGSSVWGNLAVGGVINIVSRRPEADDGEIAVSAANANTWTAAVSKNFVLNPSLSLNVTADAFSSGGYNNTSEELRAAYWPGRGASSAQRENLRVTLYFKPSENFGGFVRVGYHEQNELLGGYQYGRNLQKSPDLQASLTESIGTTGALVATAYAQDVTFNKFNGAGCYAAATYACGAPVSGGGASVTQQVAAVLQYASSLDLNTYRERGGSVVYSRRPGRALQEWQLGFDYRRTSGEDAQQSFRTPTTSLPQTLRVQRTNYGAGAQRFAGVFSQFKWHPLNRLDLIVSARVDQFGNADGIAQQTNYSNLAVPIAVPTTGGPVPGLNRTNFDPSLAARYAVTEWLALRGSAYKAFRAPGLNNLYRSFGSASISIANPLLNPETLVGTEIGFDWRRGAWSGSATAFRADVTDVVATYAISRATPIPVAVQNICGVAYSGVANAACPGTVSFYTNGQDQRTTGIELDGAWAMPRHFNVSAYLTYTNTTYTRTTTGDPTNVQLPLVPRLVGGAEVAWQPLEDWSVNTNLRYNSDMTVSNLTLAPLLRQGGYSVINAATSYTLSPRLQLSGSVTNIADKRYTDSSASNRQGISYAMPRTWSLAVTVRL
jgi:iron complex outermembrane receptor protein